MRRRPGLGVIAGLVLLLGFDSSATPDAPPDFVGAIRLSSRDPLFGGFSALSIGENGRDLIVLSDRGAYVRGRITRDGTGAPRSAVFDPVRRLRGPKGGTLTGQQADSEGLAIAPDGGLFVSFEATIRVARLDRLEGKAIDLPKNPAFARLPHNEGLEALAVDASGTVYAVPEALHGDKVPVFVFQRGKWRAPLALPRIGVFRPVAADFGPDGRFYLLERRFHGPGGFSSRLRRFDLGPKGFSSGQVLLQTKAGRHDNLEGLSIWRGPDGLRATMISDDNFLFMQVTEIVEYRLPD